MRTFKMIASKAGSVVFDERIEAETPRDAREKMKAALRLESLTGVVYAITEIPMDIIREIVIAQMAGVVVARSGRQNVDLPALVDTAVANATGGKFREIESRLTALESGSATGLTRRFDPLSSPANEPTPARNGRNGNTAIPAELANEPTRGIPTPVRAIAGPDWKAIKRHYVRTRSVKQTAAQFDLSPNTLKARIRREGWGK